MIRTSIGRMEMTRVTERFRVLAWAAALALGFAAHVGMTVQLAGRTDAAVLTAALTIGALAVAVLVAGRPLKAVASMDPSARGSAAVAGLLLVFGAPALISYVRMTDAPAGSLVVFWMSGGWAALAALAGVAVAWRHRARPLSWLAAAAGVTTMAGVAGIVADWERPSSFSPLVRFPSQEAAILGAGVLAFAGAFLLVRAVRAGKLDGALVCATGTAAVAGGLWWAADGLSMAPLSEKSAQLALAAVAWGVVCVALPRVLRSEGPARSGALLAVAPLLLTTLIVVEQFVGVAGPQPMIVSGVVAGALVLVAGAAALWRSRSTAAPDDQVAEPAGRPWWTWLAVTPLLPALVALAVPAIKASADVPPMSISWTLLGWESVAGLSALGVAALAAALAGVRRPLVPAVAALAACGGWWLLADVPMHVLKAGLAPGIEQYYGTEYGSITFVALANPWQAAAVILASSVLVMIMAAALRRGRAHTTGEPNER